MKEFFMPEKMPDVGNDGMKSETLLDRFKKPEDWGNDNINLPDFNDRLKCEAQAEKTPLSEESKNKLRESGWPDEIIDKIKTEEELAIYQEAGLTPMFINGKWCLCKEIDLSQTDALGRTNLERMKQGLAPLDKDGKPLELHHIGQKNDSPLAELTLNEHKCGGNDTILHDKSKETEIDRGSFSKERAEHWKSRAAQLENNQEE